PSPRRPGRARKLAWRAWTPRRRVAVDRPGDRVADGVQGLSAAKPLAGAALRDTVPKWSPDVPQLGGDGGR
ncbi:hypothetical protein, partial [Mycobacterium tuberculosis]|uniref:hypothetical protein n=1 Tax=Mycobacterium tuberculosis TaxID=1773 RepID=UPI00254C66FF